MPNHASRRSLLSAAAVAAVAATGASAAALPRTVRPGGRRAGPLPVPRETPRQVMARMSLEEKVGQLLVSRMYGHTATAPDPADADTFEAELGVRSAAELIARYHLGGIIYFGWADNIRSPLQVAELSNGLQRAARADGAGVPLLLTTDQEHGAVNRIGKPATLLPGAMALGAATGAGTEAAADGARRAALIAGTELAAMGVRQDYAPVADVNVNPANPVIGVRSFGADPRAVAALVAAQVRGYQGAGVAATVKHFPGHGDTDTDSHIGLPVMRHTRAEWEELDEPPFRAAVEAGVDAVMTAHIVFAALDPAGDPATLSHPIVTGILRERLGFTGVVVTDSLRMAGVRQKYGDDRVPVLALKAGCDQLLDPPDVGLAYRSVLAAVRAGELTEARIEESVLRILELKARRGLFEDPYVVPARLAESVGTPEHLAAADAVAAGTTTLLANTQGLLPLDPVRFPKLLVTGADPASPTGTSGPPTTVLAGELGALGFTATALPGGRAVAAAPDHDVVLVCTYNVPEGASTAYNLVRDLVAAGARVVTLALRNPYDPARLPPVAAALAAYSWTDGELRAAARVIAGAHRPTGRLPVPVPGRWPLGHGLTY
ncbi:glycoside hydrolase family 3 protein [Streptomyces sp. NBC_00536]|uniref:glycoside hydrolase family 3 protein n=1 Tax=Streptomyces sp. NBC_00536 TaxID=2975769 RepID=UPI002E80B6E3|nr:glycoside hydrolase family 3 N-terminal domain-containing protein [Streptomyces sp. NBC_00536]WUC79172.1 glycoside hydrolase family 3 protein [Streptomyces sp. NBC_00536]